MIERLDPNVAADLFLSLPFEDQKILFRRLSFEFAARLAPIFPYFHTFVLLHTRPRTELAAIVDKMQPAERLMFFDELPEQAWEQLMEEISSGSPETAVAPAEAVRPIVSEAPPHRRLSRRGESRRSSSGREADAYR